MKRIVGYDPKSSIRNDFQRNFVFIMDFDRLVNLEGPFYVVLVAAERPGFDNVGSWAYLLFVP